VNQPLSRLLRRVLTWEILSLDPAWAKGASVADTRDDGSGFCPFSYFDELFTVSVFPFCSFNEKKEEFTVFLF
jgi:hypothetical protein